MTDEGAEMLIIAMACAVAFACFLIVFMLDTAAAFYPWVTW